MLRNFKSVLLAVLLLSALGQTCLGQKGFAPARDTITAEELKAYVDWLADDQREGRESGTRGGYAAGNYLAQRLAELKIRPAGADGRYFQPFYPNFRNVIGWIEGRDPALRGELVVLGAHYDHVGYGNSGNSLGPIGYIHNGADDNASGVAGLLEVAEALTKLQEPPRRSILIAFWDAEERGLLGSKHWMAHPTRSERVVFHINADMIGRIQSDRLQVVGTRTSAGLRELVSRHNDSMLLLDFTWRMNAEADQYSFFQAGVPVLALHTDLHPQYHTPYDDANLIDPSGMRRIARLMFSVACDVAEMDRPRQFRPRSKNEGEEDGRRWAGYRSPPPDHPLRLGMVWREDDDEPGVLILSYVAPGSPADSAGLRADDRLYRVNGKPIAGGDAAAAYLRALPSPVRLEVERQGRIQTVELRL